MYTVGIAGVMFYLPDVVVWFRKKAARQHLLRTARRARPDGRLRRGRPGARPGDAQGRRRNEEDLSPSSPKSSRCATSNCKWGAARNEVLHELGQRTGVDDLKALAAILIQADKFGSSVAQALRVQSDSMRTRRRQMAEEKAAKTAVKLIFPLVIFIFPAIFVVLVGPAAITMINEMFPAMQAAQ